MGFLDGLLGALGSIANAIAQAIVYIFNLIVIVFQFIWQVLQLFAGYVLDFFKKVGGFFAHIWNSFLKDIFVKLWHGIQALHKWLESHLRPIIKFLQKVQKYVDKIYKTYIRPYLIMIQRIRQVLGILRLLHLKFAAQLDAILQTVVNDVNRVFTTIRGTLNTAIDLLNIIADPEKLVRKPTLIFSLRRVLHAFIRQVTGFPPAFYFPNPSPSAPKGIGKLPKTFNPDNPNDNPPASYYLGLDEGVPSLEFVDPELGPGNDLIDQMGALGFFDQSQYPAATCLDVEGCIAQAAEDSFKGDPYGLS